MANSAKCAKSCGNSEFSGGPKPSAHQRSKRRPLTPRNPRFVKAAVTLLARTEFLPMAKGYDPDVTKSVPKRVHARVLPVLDVGPGVPTSMMGPKEVIAMLIELVLFVLSAMGLVAAGQQFVQRGRNLGIWG